MTKIKLNDKQLKNLLPEDLPEFITEQEIIEAIEAKIYPNSLFSNTMMMATITKEILFDVYRNITIWINIENDIINTYNKNGKKTGNKLSPYNLDISAYKGNNRLPFYHVFNGINRSYRVMEI